MSLTLAILPLALLIVVMTATRPRRWLPLPAHIALPAVAGLAYALQLLWFRAGSIPAEGSGPASPVRWIHAAFIDGVLSALTPIGIVFGAILFFKTMEASGAMRILTGRIRGLNPNPIAQLMLVGWSFSFLIEGLCGFGAPAALAAPILVGLGFPPVRVAAMCLIMNSVPVSFGAVGTPIWFGLGELGLSQSELITVGTKAALINSAAALVIPILALRLLLPWRTVRASLGFILLTTLASVLPYAFVATLSTEFPSIIGGLCGTIVGALLAHRGIGLSTAEAAPAPMPEPAAEARGRPFGTLRAAAPLIAVVLLLAVTRIEPLGLRALLNADSPAASVALGPAGAVWVTPGLVVGFREILGTGTAWRMPLLYVPFVIPFVLVSLLAIPALRIPRAAAVSAWADTLNRLIRPAVALVGALVLVKMMMLGGEASPVMLIGRAMAGAAGGSWLYLAPLLGALGSFFSGSTTVSNLTFAPVQGAIAESLGLDITSVLALQTVGGSLGNMVCIHNIVAVAAVIGLRDRPGPGQEHLRGGVASVLRLTVVPMLIYAAIAAAGAALL